MLKTIIGVIILLSPFLLLNKFKDKKLGFAYIISFVIAFHLFLAILTQAFHIFTYPIVLTINLIIFLAIIIKTDFRKISLKVDWILVIIIIIAFIHLFSVHYNYSGRVTAFDGGGRVHKEVRNIRYPYPYFADEWYAIAFAKYSIQSKSLPLVNPLWHNSPFPNLELPFHSFVSEIILLLDLDPLTDYTVLTIFSGLLICVLIYIFFRINRVNRLSSGIACLFALYITNGANLPGIWTLIPIIMGIIPMLLGYLFMSVGDKKMILFMAFLTLIFYPPLFMFYTVSLILYFIFANISKKEKIKSISLYLIVSVFAAIILSVFVFLIVSPFSNAFSYILSKIFYETFTKNAIPDFSIWKVIPIPILILSVFGVFKLIKKKIWLVAAVFVGLIYWLLYSFRLERFIIEYARVVVPTSILIVLLSGFGLHYLIRYLRRVDFIRKYQILQIAEILILILFLISAFSYTQRDNWQELKLYYVKNRRVLNPAAPANHYLHPDDLKLFEGIKEKRFLSIPWKGTVIGAATDNYPLETKEGTISNMMVRFLKFMNADCDRKMKIAGDRKIDYVYSPKFNCAKMELIGTSSEGLYLYKVLRT